jgi:hypothetical protein
MEVVEILAMDEEVEHVVPLSTDLKASFDPIEFGGLEELGRHQRAEQVLLGHGLWGAMLEFVKDETLE